VANDNERSMRCLIAPIVLCCDPPAMALTAQLRRSDQSPSKTNLVRSTFESCRADAIERHGRYGPLPDIQHMPAGRGTLAREGRE
jgi:hypothetical protein